MGTTAESELEAELARTRLFAGALERRLEEVERRVEGMDVQQVRVGRGREGPLSHGVTPAPTGTMAASGDVVVQGLGGREVRGAPGRGVVHPVIVIIYLYNAL